MAWIDYTLIAQTIIDRLDADVDLRAFGNVTLAIEEDLDAMVDMMPLVAIYYDRRDAFDADQSLSAGQRTRYQIRFVLWCWHSSYDSLADAAALRNELLAKVEVALMRDRTLGGLINKLWLEGGEFMSAAKGDGDFASGAEIILVVDAVAATV